MNKRMLKGFTLAETLITLTILGVVAAISVPALTRQQILKANRVKIKKAMANYETVVNKMIIENNLARSAEELDNYVKNDADCSNAYNYFKVIKKEGCQFMTADRLWWDVGKNGSMSKAIVAFDKKENLTTSIAGSDTNYKAFYFQTDFDNIGSLRVMDITYGWNKPSPSLILNYSKINRFLGKDEVMKLCDSTITTNCIRKTSGPDDCYVTITSGAKMLNCYFEVLGSDGKRIFTRQGCSPTGACTATYRANGQSSIPVGIFPGYYDEQYVNCDSQADNCQGKNYIKQNFNKNQYSSLVPDNETYGTKNGYTIYHNNCSVDDKDLSTCTDNSISFTYEATPKDSSKNGKYIRTTLSTNNGGLSYEVSEYDSFGNTILSKGCDITGQNCTGETTVNQKINSSTTLKFTGCNRSGNNCSACTPANYCPSDISEYTSAENFKLLERE